MANSRTTSTSSKREELMSSVKSRDVDELIRITKSASGSELSDALAEFSNAHLEDFWESVYSLCTSTFLSEKEVDDDEFAKGINSVLKSTTDLAQATVTALLAQKCDDGGKNSLKVPQPLQETMILLHGMFPNLEDGEALKNQMSRLFEECWSRRLEGRQEFASNTIFYLLTRSTQPKSFQTDVSRVWSMRDMFEYVTLKGNEGSPQLVSLLQQCAHHPQFMATNHGIKFLAFLLTLDPGLTANLHQCIKNVLFTTPKSWHSKYGDVYFRSWQTASDSMRQNIEESCIQDLMFRAVHACRQGPHCASAALFRLMSHFHKQKTQRGVESMLVRLYAPILWRSLKVTNSDVRLNAASLMFNVFPLQDPNHHREEADAALQRQFDIINSLLSDPVIEIRVTAVLGIGRVLGMYWEMIPIQVIQCLVTSLVQDMIHDTASPAVREAVLKVMFQLCDNHLCIPMLKKVLPELGNFIHDNSEKVRVAMLDLLLKVKGLRAIKYWSIVPIEHILARLETDSRFVVRRIMSLISSSFVPINQPPSQQVERCLALISSNRGAARQFFLNLSKSLGIVDTAKYILVLCRYALESSRLWTKSSHLQSEDKNEDKEEDSDVGRKPRTKGKKRRPIGRNDSVSVDTEEEDENSSVERRGSTDASQTDSGGEVLFNMDLLSGLMEGVYLMFTSIVSELSSSEHVAMKEGLMKKLSVTVRELIRISQEPLLEEALVGLAGHLPSRTLPLVSQSLFNKLKRNISQKDVLDSSLDVELATVVKALVQWGRTGEMLGMVQEAIAGFLQKEISCVSSKGAKRSPKGGKKVAFATEEVSLDVEKTLEILDAMISHAECRPILMNKHKKGIASLIENLEEGMLKKIEMHLKLLEETTRNHEKKKAPPSDSESELSITLRIFSTYLRLSVFLCLKPNNGLKETDEADNDHGDDFSEIGLSNLKSCLAWILNVVLPPLQSPQGLLRSVHVLSQLAGMTLKVCSGLVMVGVNDAVVFDKAGEICTMVMKLPSYSLKQSLIENVLDFAYQITQVRQVAVDSGKDGTDPMEQGQETDQDKNMNPSPSQSPLQFALGILESSIKHLAAMSRESTSDNVKATATLHPSMKEMFLVLVRPRENQEMFNKTVNVVTNLTIQEVEKMSQQDVMDDREGLPWLTNLLTCVKKSSKTLGSFVEKVIDHLSSDQVTIHSLHGIVYLTKHLKTNPSDSVNPDLEEAINNCLRTISPNGMDEDVFRDVKGQVEQKISEWTGSS